MNYLAHIYLSGNDKERQIGGFIADAVKGSDLTNFPDKIRQGIILHRKIDYFTDTHPAVKELTRDLRSKFGRYAVILPDMYFDYLLALHFDEYSRQSLLCFSYKFYSSLLSHYRFLPSRIKRFMWHFIFTNRLYRYKSTKGLKESLNIMVSHHRIVIDVNETVRYLEQNFPQIDLLFRDFFTQLQANVHIWKKDIQ